MRRRAFLQCVTLSTGLALLPWRALPGWQVQGDACAPGAPLQVDVARHVPVGSVLRLSVRHDRGEGSATQHETVRHVVKPGARVELVTPYPHNDLVPGLYTVTLDLHDSAGRLLETSEVGRYTVRRFRFSA